MAWDKIGETLAIVLPFSGVILTVALKVIHNKKREILPCCSEKFKTIDDEMKMMKKGSTDRQSILTAVQAAMELLIKSNDDRKRDYKELTTAINQTAKDVAIISTNIGFMSKKIEEIRGIDKKNKRSKSC